MSPARQAGFPLARLLAGRADVPADLAREVSGLCQDSRHVRAGDLFFALAGSHAHGLAHAAQAAAAGACAIVYDPARGGAELASALPGMGIPGFPVERLGESLGLIANRFFGEPSLHLQVLGVTGTNGKTSCSHFFAHALGGAGEQAAVIGTLGWGAPGALQPTSHTTPDAIELHALLAKLQAAGATRVAMEASSHGLDQGRLNGIRFAGALFTNFSRDHLDYHPTMEAYLDAKLRLVEWPGLKFVVFNLDDPSAEAIAERACVGARKIGYSLAENATPYPGVERLWPSNIRQDQGGIAFEAHFSGHQAPVFAPLYGEFNVENLLGVLAALIALDFDLAEAAGRLAAVRAVPGRMEPFAGPAGPTVVVDYAHTPDALHKVLASLRRHCRGALWVVFGCGGDRDRGKRPQMGLVAETLADRVVLTDDNPRSEDGDAIIREILDGCMSQDLTVIRDRRLAIAWAFEQLSEGDVLLVAGKGHEDTQDIGGVKYPFSDRAVVRQLLGLPEEAAPCA